MVVGEGFEPSKLSWQSYSLLPLTARESHLYTYFQCWTFYNYYETLDGAGTRIRTVDLLITSQLLYQLSYAGIVELHFTDF